MLRGFYAGLKNKHVQEDKKNKQWTEFDGGGEYLVFSISLSLHREGRQRKDGSLSHAAKSELTVPLTCLQRTLLKTVARSLDVNVTTPSSPNKDEAVSCTPSMSFPMQPSFIIPPI
jgi:hypothetical protein